jgi:hypothetical protein
MAFRPASIFRGATKGMPLSLVYSARISTNYSINAKESLRLKHSL